jgi:hypothetical protein
MAKPQLYSEVSFDEKSSANEPASFTLRFMRKFWRELTITLALFGIREYLVLSMCVISVYLYMIGSSWTLILSMIVPSLMVLESWSSVRNVFSLIHLCSLLAGACSQTSRTVGRTDHACSETQSKGKFEQTFFIRGLIFRDGIYSVLGGHPYNHWQESKQISILQELFRCERNQ